MKGPCTTTLITYQGKQLDFLLAKIYIIIRMKAKEKGKVSPSRVCDRRTQIWSSLNSGTSTEKTFSFQISYYPFTLNDDNQLLRNPLRPRWNGTITSQLN